MIEQNYSLAIGKMENVIRLYQNVPLSLIGKVTVIKSLVIPKLVHILQVLPLPSKKYIDQINRLVRNFLWNNGKAKISLKQLTQCYEDGGLNLTDIVTLNNAIKISWIKRLCMSQGGFQSLFSFCTSNMNDLVWSLDDVSLQKLIKVTKTLFGLRFLKLG
jgi:hypothetical protein